jgi:hypothetical protein
MWSNARLLRFAILAVVTTAAGSTYAQSIPPTEAGRPSWPEAHPALCADRLPLCVHAREASTATQLAPTLRELETIATRIHAVLGWPQPLPDAARGGSNGFDVYLDSQLERPYHVSSDPPLDPRGRLTSAFARLQPGLPDGCYRAAILAEALARAGIFALDATAQEATAVASAAYVASVAAPCPMVWLDPIDAFQVHPERAISHPDPQHQRGAMLFPWFLQQSRGAGGPVDLLHALWVLGSLAPTGPAPRHDADEPDFFDAVHQGVGSDLGRVLLDFAVARAFVGNRDDGLHMPETRVLGPQGAVRFDWSIPYSSLPRRLAPARPVEPSGASYIWLSLDRVPEGKTLAVRARWETPDVFRFAFVLVDAQGVAIARFDPVSPQREPVMQTNIERLQGASGVVVVACNVGSTLPDVAFDPDILPYTPRSYELSLYAL